MRKLILAVTILALTAVTAFTAGGALVGSTDPGTDAIQKRSGGVAGNPQGGLLRGGYDIIARGDMSGTGGGGKMGGMRGDMMGGMGKGR